MTDGGGIPPPQPRVETCAATSKSWNVRHGRAHFRGRRVAGAALNLRSPGDAPEVAHANALHVPPPRLLLPEVLPPARSAPPRGPTTCRSIEESTARSWPRRDEHSLHTS